MLREQVLLPGGFVLEVFFESAASYRLALAKGRRVLVEYGNDIGYDFKSVEQLRYDFEKDVESALHQGR